jgi:L-fucose isomerase-like protein
MAMDQTPRIKVRIAFVPTYRGRYTDWCRKMQSESVAALRGVTGIELLCLPDARPDGNGSDSGKVPYGAVHTLDEAEVAAAYLLRQNVDGLILCPLDFGDERSVATVAERLGVPVLLYATKEPPAVQDSSLARVSDSYCGNLAVAAALHRRGVIFHFAGLFFPAEPALGSAVATFVRAVAVVKALRNARIGQVGARPGTFESVSYDELAMVRKFGQRVVHRELYTIMRTAVEFPEGDPGLREIEKALRGAVAAVTVSDDGIRKAARLERALADFYEREKLSAMGVQCWPTVGHGMGIEPCAVFGRLTGRHMLTACESDVLGSLSMLATYGSALGGTVPHFVDWTIQHREKPNCLLAWHCGNAPTCLAADQARTALRSRRNMTGAAADGAKQPGVLFQFQVAPGDVTFCRLAEYDGEWKMLIAEGRIAPSDETLCGTWSWVEVPDHDRLYRTLVEEGFIHHASMIHGRQADALALACKFMAVRPVRVG